MKLAYYYAKVVQRLRGKAIKNSKIHVTAVVNNGCNILGSSLGRYSYCGYDCQIVDAEIGSFCSISDHVFIGGAEHPIEWISTSPVFQNVRHSGPVKRFAKFEAPVSKRTTIGSDVWIGHGVTIKSGVHIGHGAVIGSNALVTKDVPPYAIVGGVPAKVIRYRFDQNTINDLLDIKWWELSDSMLEKYASKITMPDDFITQIKSLKNNV